MTKTKVAGIAIMATLIALPVFAETAGIGVDVSAGATVGAPGVRVTADAKIQARITKGKKHADQEIDRRIKVLNELNTRVQAMARVSAAEKAAISTDVQNEVSSLSTLKAKIDADTDINILKADIKSITQSYRIFMLIIPQGRIEIAADKIHTVGDSMTTFSGKLGTRISAEKSNGKDTASLEAALSDMNAKIADSKVQADAAVSLVANLTPDNGDKTKMEANHQALKDARAKIKAGLEDLKTARKDAEAILKGLKGFNASATSTMETETH